MNPLLYTETHYYGKESLTIEGNALRITINNSWKSLAIEGSPLLVNNLFQTIPYYRTKTLSIL